MQMAYTMDGRIGEDAMDELKGVGDVMESTHPQM